MKLFKNGKVQMDINYRMKILLILLSIFFASGNLHSQSSRSSTKTPYEQKLSSLLKQFLMDIGFDYATAEKASNDPVYANSLQSQINQKMERNSLRAVGLSNQLQLDLENAKSLMNSEEKEKDRLQVAKVSKVEDDQKNQEQYLRSDSYRLKKIIHDKYVQWSTKGEFEKTEDYQKRMADKPKEVRDIIISSFTEYTKYMNVNGVSQGDHFYIECHIGNYNPDTESLELTLQNKTGLQWQGSINISPDKAGRIKSGARTATMNGVTVQFNSILQVIQGKCSLAFSQGNIISTKIKISLKSSTGNKREYYDFKMTSAPPVLDDKAFFTAENLGIDMQGNENFTFADINLACH